MPCSQIRELQLATSQSLGFVAQYSVTSLAAIGLALYTAWDVTLVTIATIPLGVLFLAWISRRMQPAVELQSKHLTGATKTAHSAILAIDTVKCYNGQYLSLQQYAEHLQKAAGAYLMQARSNALQIGFVRFLMLSMFVQGFWYGSRLAADGKRTSGQILTAFWACLIATQTFEQILPQLIVLEKGRAAAAALQAALTKIDHDKHDFPLTDRKTPAYCQGDIHFRNVSRLCDPVPFSPDF